MTHSQNLPWPAGFSGLVSPPCAPRQADKILAQEGAPVTMEQAGDITILLQRWRQGDAEAEALLFEAVLPDLRKLARYLMSRDRSGHTLQPSALLNEAYLRLVRAKGEDWQNRRHFFAMAAMMMRRCLVDYARARPRVRFAPMDDVTGQPPAPAVTLETAVAIGRLLDELRVSEPSLAEIIDLKFFLGFTDQETCDALGLSLRSMQRLYQKAREWLYRRLYEMPTPV
jgi:RNA polymerase sigma-70 factor (ECF subfamily)